MKKEEEITTMEILEALQVYAERMDQRLADLETHINEKFYHIESRLDKIDQHLSYHGQWLQQLDTKMDTLVTKKQFTNLLFILEDKHVLSRHEREYITES